VSLFLALVGFAAATPFDTPTTVYPGGELDFDMAVDDLNLDGLPDVIEWYRNELYVMVNLDEAGADKTLVGTTATNINSVGGGGDLDGDGFHDIVFRATTIHVALSNNGAWQIVDTGIILAAGEAEMGDIDNDGDTDIVWAGDEVYILENVLGDGSAYLSYSIYGVDPRGVELVDLDGDGDLDIVGHSGSVYVLENDVLGFTWTYHSIGGGSTSGVAIGDIDNDGDLDVLRIASTRQTFGWELSAYSQDAPMDFSSMFLLEYDTASELVWLGSGRILARSGISEPFIITVDETGPIAKEDVGLALFDIEPARVGRGAMGVTRGGLTVQFTDTGTDVASDSWLIGFASSWEDDHDVQVSFGDIDGDGDADMSVLTARRDGAMVLENTTRGGKTWRATRMDDDDSGTIKLGDINGDGLDDAIVGHEEGITWFDAANDWEPHFNVQQDDINFVLPMDYDGDGDVDVLFGEDDFSSPYVEAAVNQTGELLDVGTVASTRTGYSPDRGVVIDVEPDGDLDAIIDDTLFQWRPGNVFTATQPWTRAECAHADIDGDGDADRVCSDTGFITLYTSTAGVLWTSSTIASAPASCGIAVGDIDEDGDVDLVGADCAGGATALYQEDDGSWTQELLFPGDVETVLLVDLDGDDDLDLITVGNVNQFDVHENLTIFEEYCDVPGDHDGDGLVGCSDPDCFGTPGCPACPPGQDADGDNICDDVDLCFGDELTGDDDADGRCNDTDTCFGDDLTGDTDGDGTCDDADACPIDPTDDSDGDGFCDSVDLCDGDDFSGDADGDGLCDDTDLTLDVSNLVRGGTMLARVVNAEPNATVDWWASRFGPGDQPCVPGRCGNLDQPVRIATTTADANGIATLQVAVPTTLPAGRYIFLQALSRTGLADVTQVVVRRVR
jgi:hypothetical protein